MTAQEAIKAIKDNKPTSGYYILCEALDVACEALEKQIPKKMKEEKWIYTKCSCGRILSIHHGDGYYEVPHAVKMEKYCHNCGQKLDWGE